MMRVGLLRLPVVPLGFLLVFYEFGAVSAASETIHLDTSTTLQAEVDLAEDGTVRSLVSEKTSAPARSEENLPLVAPPEARDKDSQMQSSPGAGPRDTSRQPAAGATTPAEVESSKALSRDNPPAAINSSAAQKMAQRKSPSMLQMLEGHEQNLWIGVSIAAVFFLIGWISGGNYYVRRERRRRTKLSF
jgi:hypothetical protein